MVVKRVKVEIEEQRSYELCGRVQDYGIEERNGIEVKLKDLQTSQRF
jgi:hypothetical protein